MILDIIIVSVVLMFALIGLKRGIAKTVYGLLCLAAAGILAYLSGKLLAEFVYNNFILSSITDSVKTSFEASSVNSEKVSENVFTALPAIFSGVLAGMGITQKGFASSLDSASDFTQKAAMTTVENVISPVLISFLSVGFIALLFIIFILILKFVIGRKILKLFKLPVIKWVNSLLGFVFGVGEGAVIVFVGITVLRIVSFFSSDPTISKELIDSSHIFSSIYYWDFTVLLSNIPGIK
ncbi:MAG: CvpA family protein [Ruminococcus sp.]|nr:CvpA family protein [Ruminococcus sp.]